MRFAVNLDIFRGPLDLLLYLVRKHELDVADIPLARVIDQYLEYIAVLELIDVDAVGDFWSWPARDRDQISMVLPGTRKWPKSWKTPRRNSCDDSSTSMIGCSCGSMALRGACRSPAACSNLAMPSPFFNIARSIAILLELEQSSHEFLPRVFQLFGHFLVARQHQSEILISISVLASSRKSPTASTSIIQDGDVLEILIDHPRSAGCQPRPARASSPDRAIDQAARERYRD